MHNLCRKETYFPPYKTNRSGASGIIINPSGDTSFLTYGFQVSQGTLGDAGGAFRL